MPAADHAMPHPFAVQTLLPPAHALAAASGPGVAPSIWWVAIAIGGIYVLYTVFSPFRRKRKDPLAKGPPTAGLAQQRAVERQMQNLLVELSEMARQVTAQLDTRSAKLQVLIDDADARLAALRSAVSTPTADAAEPPMFRPSPARRPDADPRDDEATIEVPMFRTRPAGPVAADGPPAAVAAEAAGSASPPNEAVYALADRGRGAAEIARELGRPRGEVDLILLLRPPATPA